MVFLLINSAELPKGGEKGCSFIFFNTFYFYILFYLCVLNPNV